jgi:uncharacterized protein
MAATNLLCDTGPLVAFLNRGDGHHEWADEQFGRLRGPLLTCEAVLSEAIFLLCEDGLSCDPLFEMGARGKLLVDFCLPEHWADVRRLLRKYADQPMSLADACLVRMSELKRESVVLTLDADFKIYRRHGRDAIPLIAPFR